MGLFDESDSDDDIPTAVNNSGGMEDEEDDTLEAYMNSLNDNDNATSSNNNNCSGEGRLDVDAEDEATSHWNVDKPKVNGSSSGRLLPKHEDTNGKLKAESTTTMSGFVRAGGNNKQPSQDNNTQHDNEDTDKFTNLKDVREHQKQMIHAEIDPLEKINHNSIQYNTFNKIFYKPNYDTKEGHAWRKEHDVVCTPSNFDPILGFGELSSEGVFPEELIRTIAQSGYDAPTIVQSQTLSVALSGNDALITVSYVIYTIIQLRMLFI